MHSNTERNTLIEAFLARHGWGDAKRAPLAGDASFRRYERVRVEDRQAVLMDAPPESEDVRPFMRVGGHLQACGLSAPEILASDTEHGFLLLEDLGDSLYTKALQRSPVLEEQLYLAATDVLSELYSTAGMAGQGHFLPYDEALMLRECALFSDWFLPAVMDASQAAKLGQEYMAVWQELLRTLPACQSVLVLRDFHADNLLWLEERKGVKRVGLLDFQDAVIGHPAYDIVSFLEDARRDVSAQTVDAVIRYYLDHVDIAREEFLAAYALLGAQRNCKIVGIFLRLCVRDGKRNYLTYLPRVWQHLEHDLQHPALAALKRWMDAHILPQWRGALDVPSQRALQA
jgi:aminoglycoside/choline kinase family phosphotransferase